MRAISHDSLTGAEPAASANVFSRPGSLNGAGKRAPHVSPSRGPGKATTPVTAKPWTATVAAYIAQNCEILDGDYSVDDEPEVRVPHTKKPAGVAIGKRGDCRQLPGELFLKVSALEAVCSRLDGVEELLQSVQAQVTSGLERVERASASCLAFDMSLQPGTERILASLREWRSEQLAHHQEFAQLVRSQLRSSVEGVENTAATAAADRVCQQLERSLNSHLERILASPCTTQQEPRVASCAPHGAAKVDVAGVPSDSSSSAHPGPRWHSDPTGYVPSSPLCSLALDHKQPTLHGPNEVHGTQKSKASNSYRARGSMFGEIAKTANGAAYGAAEARSIMFGLARRWEQWMDYLAEQEPPPPPSCLGISSRKWKAIGLALEKFSHLIIFMNIAYLWYTVNRDVALAASGAQLDPEQEEIHDYINWAFTAFFTVEIVLRISVYKTYFFLGHHKWWNLIDAVLVATSYLEVAGAVNFLRAFRMFRVAKLLRLQRLFRDFGLHELSIMMDCLTGSMSLLFWCLCVIGMMSMLFSLLIVQLLTIHFHSAPPTDDREWVDQLLSSFGSVEGASFTLFAAVTGGTDWGDVYEILRPAGAVASIVLVLYVLLFYIAVANVVTSTFVDRAFKHAKAHNEAISLSENEQQQKEDAKEMRALFESMDLNCDGVISAEEFRRCMDQPEFIFFLQERGLKITDVNLFFHMLTETSWGKNMDLMTLADFCLRVRGNATRIDLYMLEHQMHSLQEQILHEVREQRKT